MPITYICAILSKSVGSRRTNKLIYSKSLACNQLDILNEHNRNCRLHLTFSSTLSKRISTIKYKKPVRLFETFCANEFKSQICNAGQEWTALLLLYTMWFCSYGYSCLFWKERLIKWRITKKKTVNWLCSQFTNWKQIN